MDGLETGPVCSSARAPRRVRFLLAVVGGGALLPARLCLCDRPEAPLVPFLQNACSLLTRFCPKRGLGDLAGLSAPGASPGVCGSSVLLSETQTFK